MSDAARLETLREFGFSPYASRAYVALLELGASDARSVSREARIPAPKVYGTLNQLMEKGLARLILDTPRRYEPVPFGEFLAQRRAAHLEEAQRLTQITPSLVPLFGVSSRRATSDRGTFSVLRGRQPILDRQRQLASQVSSSLLLATSEGLASRASCLLAVLREAGARGVRPCLLLPRAAAPPGTLRELREVADVRVRAATRATPRPVTYAIFDHAHAVVTHHVPDDADLHTGHDVAVHVSETAIVESLHDLVDAGWAAARPKAAGSRTRRRA